jgi:hypothetical protein
LGSVGRRHLTNLRALGWRDIRCYRTGRSTLPDADLSGTPVDYDLDGALAHQPLRDIETAMGDGVKRVYDSEIPVMRKLRRFDQLMAASAEHAAS